MIFIKSNRDFQDILKSHRKFEGQIFNIFWQRGHNYKFEVGIIVGKKIGKAVIRNKIKRRIKSFLRENKNLWLENSRILISAKRGAAKANWSMIKKDLTILLDKILSK